MSVSKLSEAPTVAISILTPIEDSDGSTVKPPDTNFLNSRNIPCH